MRFEYPSNNFMDVNPLVTASYSEVVKRWVAGKLYARAVSNPFLSRSQLAYLMLARVDVYLKGQQQIYTERERTNLNTMLALPKEWTTEHRVAWADGQYRKYIRAMDAVAAQHDVAVAHFIQPAPAILKPLTDEEKRVVGDLGYRALYERIASDVLGLAREGTPIFSLLDLFAANRDTLYADTIHLRQAADGSSKGYELMAQRIAVTLASAWRLQPKTPAPRVAHEAR